MSKKKKILDRLVLAFYIEVGNLEDKDIPKFINLQSKRLKLRKRFKDVETFFIPTRGKKGSVIEVIHKPINK